MVEGVEPGRRDEHDAEAIDAALAHVLSSDAFRAAPQLSAFLSFVVARALDGRRGELKGYTIAVEALGRGPDFDPQADPIVRVEAGRLRRALAQYYAGEGSGDPVRIAMPIGAYVPTFERVCLQTAPDASPTAPQPSRQDGAESAAAPASSDARSSRRWLGLAGLGLLVGLASLTLWHRGERGAGSASPRSEAVAVSPPRVETETTGSAQGVRLPIVAVSMEDQASDPALVEIAQRFLRLLVDAMARFDDRVTVIAPGSATSADMADYMLEMTIARQKESAEGFARLRAAKDGRVVWTGSTSRDLPGVPDLPEIARRLAIRLAEPFGVIHADLRQNAGSAGLRCLIDAAEARRTMTPEHHLAARTCIERLLSQDRSFHPAWSQFAWLILDEYTSGLNPQPGRPLDRALSAALNAIRLAPSSARSQQAMMDVLFARGQIEEALQSGREAMASNPYDPEVMADLGARLVQLNRPAEGLPLLERAIALSTGRPPWYDFFAFLGADLTGAERLADGYAAVFVADSTPLSLLGLALRCAARDDNIGLQDALRRLVAAMPLYRVDARLQLMRIGFGPAVTDHILARLAPAFADLVKAP